LVYSIVTLILFAEASPANPRPNEHLKISPAIRFYAPDETLKVWVSFIDKGFATQSDLRRAIEQYQTQMSNRAKHRRAFRAQLSFPDFTDLPIESRYIEAVLRVGGQLRSTSRWLNAIGLEATTQEIDAIALLPCVRAIDPIRQDTAMFDLPINGSLLPGAPSSAKILDYGSAKRQITQIQADFLHQEGFFGTNIVIGLLDTGFNLEHTALERVEVIAQRDFVNDDANTADEVDQDDPDQDDHGSAVLGILAGDAPGKLIGIAPRARYLLGKTERISQRGVVFERQIEEDWWIEGLEWLEEMGADVVSSSLGYFDWYRFADLDGKTSKITIAANLAVQKGLPVIIAAGNLGAQPMSDEVGLPGRITPPADGFDVLAIGAVDRDGLVSPFSSRGPTFDGRIKPDLMAMGIGVTSIDTSTREGFISDFTGTSAATPLAAGVVALLMEAFPVATARDIVTTLRMTASQSNKPDNIAGYGIIRAQAAYEELLHQFGHTGQPKPIAVQPVADLLQTVFGKLKREGLLQNYPNPFNAETWIPFKIVSSDQVVIRIYHVDGSLVNVLELGRLSPGDYSAKHRAAYWDGRNLYGERAASGTYFYVLELQGETHTRKMIILE
jgi:subtilisin family serine protease